MKIFEIELTEKSVFKIAIVVLKLSLQKAEYMEHNEYVKPEVEVTPHTQLWREIGYTQIEKIYITGE